MRKQFELMLIILVCGILGVITSVIANQLYTQGIIIDELISGTITINDLTFIIFFAWIVIGIIIGVFKD